jgi:hypothetical protein
VGTGIRTAIPKFDANPIVARIDFYCPAKPLGKNELSKAIPTNGSALANRRELIANAFKVFSIHIEMRYFHIFTHAAASPANSVTCPLIRVGGAQFFDCAIAGF